MTRTLTRKTYPLVKWLVVGSAVILAGGLWMSQVIQDPNHADVQLLIIAIVIAALLPFAALFAPHREVYEVALPSDRLQDATRTELTGILDQLEASKAKGEIPEERYNKAKAKIMAEIEHGKK
ncbi:MAG: hypothetical protein ACYDBQ_06710 [Thermoplasmatota archaeon]